MKELQNIRHTYQVNTLVQSIELQDCILSILNKI